MKFLFLLALPLPLAAGAQVKKCEIEGKTVYSDSLCGQTGSAVSTSANSIDHSGLRAQVAKDKSDAAATMAKEKAAAAKEKRFAPGKDVCGNPIDLSHAPSERLKNERTRCQAAKVREYNRPSY